MRTKSSFDILRMVLIRTTNWNSNNGQTRVIVVVVVVVANDDRTHNQSCQPIIAVSITMCVPAYGNNWFCCFCSRAQKCWPHKSWSNGLLYYYFIPSCTKIPLFTVLDKSSQEKLWNFFFLVCLPLLSIANCLYKHIFIKFSKPTDTNYTFFF